MGITDIKTPKISIVIPVYKVEDYISRCYNSITKQTFTNIECIFVDDCSPDNSINILNSLVDQYSGAILFSIIRHDKNKGPSAARNTGINNAAGEYIYFLDSDDEATENCMNSLAAVANKYQDVDIVQGNSLKVSSESKNRYEIGHRNFPEYSEDQSWVKKLFFTTPGIPKQSTNKLIRRGFIIDNDLYFREGINIHEDTHFVFQMAQKIKSIAFTTDYCYIRYSDNPDSIMNSKNALKSLQFWQILLSDMLTNIDAEIKKESYNYIYKILRKNMLTEQITSDSHLLLKYKKIVKKCLKNAFSSLDLLKGFGLLFFLFPYNIYSSYIPRKFINRLLRVGKISNAG